MTVNLNFVYVFVMALFTDKKNIYATRILFQRHFFSSVYWYFLDTYTCFHICKNVLMAFPAEVSPLKKHCHRDSNS